MMGMYAGITELAHSEMQATELYISVSSWNSNGRVKIYVGMDSFHILE